MKKIITAAFIILFFSTEAFCQQLSKVGTTAAPFLEIPAGAKATALGQAYTAIASGAESMYWNPASMEWFQGNSVSVNYSPWFADMKYYYFSGVLHLGEVGSFGASVTSLSTPYMLVRTVDYPDGIGQQFNAADFAIGVGYAKKITDRFSFGATFKYIDRRIWEMNATAIAMDFGILYQVPFLNMKFGMSILNFGTKLQMQGVDAIVTHDLAPSMAGNNDQILANLHTGQWNLPLSLRFGLSYQIIQTSYHELLVAVDYIHPNDNFASVNVGAEYGFMNHFFIRGGYNQIGLSDSQEGLSLGGGIKYQFVGIDYSYVKTKYLGLIQQFSVDLKF